MRSARRRCAAILLPHLVVGLLALLALAALPASAQRRVELYKAQHRAADELLPFAEAAMTGAGTATLDPATNALVLVGDPTSVAEAIRLLRSQDRAARTLVLHHGTRRLRDLAAQGFAVRWRAVAGDFRIGGVAPPGASESSTSVRADAAVEKLSQSLTAVIRMTEGAQTRIETGHAVPYTTVGPSGASTEFVDATTGFESSARILGDGRIEVDLASFARELAPGGMIAGTTGSTQVLLEPGELVVIGTTGSSDTARRVDSSGGTSTRAEADESVVLLRADVEH